MNVINNNIPNVCFLRKFYTRVANFYFLYYEVICEAPVEHNKNTYHLYYVHRMFRTRNKT